MFKRICGLLVTIMLPVLLLAVIDQVEGLVGETAVDVPGDVIISEVAWGGTRASSADEWIELYNNTGNIIDLAGWTLGNAGGGITISLQGVIPAQGFFLLERTNDDTVSDIPADQIYTGGLSNGGDSLYLYDDSSQMIDSANGNGGGWPAGTGSPDYYSMERTGRTAADEDANWESNDGSIIHNGLDANGGPITGTPKSDNSGWIVFDAADLGISKNAPAQAVPNSTLVYGISVQNDGGLTATAVILTDTLPENIVYVSDDSGYIPGRPDSRTLVWQVGQLAPGGALQFSITTSVGAAASGSLVNVITVTTTATETNLSNNRDTAVTTINGGEAAVLLDAVHYYAYDGNDDEAVALRNVSAAAVDLTGWTLADAGASESVLPPLFIQPGEILWLTKDADAFYLRFGFWPDAAAVPGGSGVPALTGSWPGFANSGDAVLLANGASQQQDALVYGSGDITTSGWSGTAVQPYAPSSAFAQTGQILYRMRDQLTGQPVPDTDTAADWAQSTGDVINGRKVRYPGWDLDEFFQTMQVTETAVLTIAIAPDNAYHALVAEIDSAASTIYGESLTLESVAINDALIRAANRGVTVTLLLEGSGVSDQEHYVCLELEAAGGLCSFMINDASASPQIYDRYSYLHAKFLLIDGQRTVVSTQNFTPTSLPDDDKSDGSWGRRGVLLITDAPQVAAHVQTVFDRDYDLVHQDIITGTSHLDPLPRGFVPITTSGGITSVVRFPQPLAVQGTFSFELVQSPENSLRDADGLLGMVNRAGAGDVVLVQQLYERPYWGASSSNATDDPNPRLEAYLSAARRGARVRLLLDAFFDNGWEAASNAATCAYVRAIARAEHLALECALGNPTGLGIHNKMVLVQANGRGYIHIGSINGSELSSKGNRELALQVQSDEAYALLSEMFDRDWPYRAYLPIMLNDVYGPAGHLLISEIQYNPSGADEDEYVEIVNPTGLTVDMSGFSLGDAVNRTDFEDVRRFPAGTTLAPQATLVVAGSAEAFYVEFNAYPDFEILETVTAVPNLIDDPTWGDTAAFFQLGNAGDEVLLRNSQDQIVDVVTYGSGSFPGVIPHPLVTIINAVLERYPYWQDTDDCTIDFREWPFPSPGSLPD
jgi:uncharacterized repeat protein (TIGR01451 family)